MIRAPLPDLAEADPDIHEGYHHQSNQSLGTVTIDDDGDDGFWTMPSSKDGVEKNVDDYEEQKRRRSWGRKAHRLQQQRRGSIEDYEQSDDVQFIQRIQSFNSLTGQEIARIQHAAFTPIVKKPPVRTVVEHHRRSRSKGHERKNTLDSWKEKAAEIKDRPAFPPHQLSADPKLRARPSISTNPLLKSSGGVLQRFVHDDKDLLLNENEEDDAFVELKTGLHQRSPTLQEWMTKAASTDQAMGAPGGDKINMTEDQRWASKVVQLDTLKRFKQQKPASIVSGDLFSPPPSHEVIIEEADVQPPHGRHSRMSSQDRTKIRSTREFSGRELIRDCLRVIGTMFKIGMITDHQKLALKGLALRQDARIIAIAIQYRMSQDDSDGVRDMELGLVRLVGQLD